MRHFFSSRLDLSLRRVLLSKPKDPIAFLAAQVKKVSQAASLRPKVRQEEGHQKRTRAEHIAVV